MWMHGRWMDARPWWFVAAIRLARIGWFGEQLLLLWFPALLCRLNVYDGSLGTSHLSTDDDDFSPFPCFWLKDAEGGSQSSQCDPWHPMVPWPKCVRIACTFGHCMVVEELLRFLADVCCQLHVDSLTHRERTNMFLQWALGHAQFEWIIVTSLQRHWNYELGLR